jgi:subtilisin family serine protease
MLRSSPLLLSLAIALALPAGQAAHAADAPAAADERSVYIVVFEEPAVAEFRGFAATDKQRPGLKPTAPAATGAGRLDPRSEAVAAYRDYLGGMRRIRLGDASARIGRALAPRFVYDFALNGVAVELSAAEAATLASQPGIRRVQREFVHRPMTDRGPAWVQAPAVWDGTATGTARRGEGAVVGIVDTGVRATHASFAAVSALDGYAHANPRGVFLGNSGTGSTPAPKNNKLIGVWDFTLGTGDAEANDGGDLDGHGTHVAATVAGNPVDFTAGVYSARMSGVAPRANLVSYKACELEALCRGSWTLAAINQAIADQVDVINYSIGGDAEDPWLRFGGTPTADDSAEAMLNARAAGITVVVAAGNDGPQPGTLNSPGNSPWVVGVAAVSHDRAVINTLTGLAGAGTPPGGGSLVGSGNTNLGTGTALVPIVRDPAHPYCAAGSNPGASPPTGATLPPTWTPTTFSGMIVVCERATVHPVGYARVEMAHNVQQAGGVGMILLNQDGDGLSTVADSYVIPMVHLSATDSQAMRAWLDSGSGQVGRLTGAMTQTAPSFGDRLASFSGRGPVPAMGVLKPDVAAPGVSIYAAGITSDSSVAVKGGTSMASPHVAGAAALLRSLNPALTPSQIGSALVMTARDSVLLPSAAPATPHDQGAGTIDVARASRAGLYLEATAAEFRAARSTTAHTLNLPAIASQRCFETCTLSRRFRLMPGVASGQYSISVDMPVGTSATPSVSALSLSGVGTATLDLTFDVAALANQWVYGRLNLVNTSGDGRPDLHLPIAIYSDPFQSGNAPADVERTVTLERGHFDVVLSGMVAMPDARFIASDLVEPVTRNASLGQDLTSDPYDDLSVIEINPKNLRYTGTVPASGAQGAVDYRVRTAITSPAPDLDLFIGLDTNGDGLPSLAEELCRATGPTAIEQCAFTVRSRSTPQTYWVLVQGSNVGGGLQTVAAESSAIPLDAGSPRGLVATGPGMTDSTEAFTLRLGYDAPGLVAGARRVGVVTIQSREGNTIAELPVGLVRSGSGVAPFALADNVGRRLTLPAGTAQDRLFFDVPPHATEVVFRTQSAANVDLYVARVANGAASADSTIAPAPARAQASASATTASGDETITLSGAALSAGRWYVTPVNGSGAAADVIVTAQVSASGARPGFRAGHYFNPARSGHGAFIDFAGPAGNPDQWLMVWYTYLEDGTPTWYYTQGASPGADGIFRGDLMRVVWNGSASHATDVGDVSLTELGAESVAFSYNLDGSSGSETLSRLGAGGGCATFNAQPLDVSGHWYSPSLSGFGYSYQVIGGASPQEVFVPYVYDGNGFPRWVYGQRAFDGGASAMTLQWFDGFCPTCAASGLVPSAAGSGTRSLVTNGVGAMSSSLVFTGALSGAWNQSRPVALLSQPKSCD